MPASTVFVNGRIYTLDRPGTIAEALAVEDGRITAVGSTNDIRALAGPGADEIDLQGKPVIPGCIDTHCHMLMHGTACTRSVDLTDCRSISELQKRLRDHWAANPAATCLVGERFDQEIFAEGRWVTRQDLDEVSARIPIVVARLCYHAVVANTAALTPSRSRLTEEQWQTGILTEDDVELAWSQVPDCTPDELEKAVLYALNDARSAGVTSVNTHASSVEELALLRRLRDEGRLPVRVRFQWPYNLMNTLVEEGICTTSGDDFLRVGAIKIFMDGSMGARTCAMIEEFADEPGNCGMLFRDADELAEMLIQVQKNRNQAAIHAIGDRAISESVKAIEKAMPHGNAGNALRHRLEHVALISPRILEDMARLNVVASIQPQFIITDFWTRDRVGLERYKFVYPFRSMLKAGIRLGMGSDCPVERLSAMELLHRAVNRDESSQHECLSVEQTLRLYTSGSAYICFEENDKGSLEVGKLADFVVLSDDPFAVDKGDLGKISPVSTVVGGKPQ